MDITPKGIAQGARCFTGIADKEAAEIYLLLAISGLSLTPAQLAKAAACFVGQPKDVVAAEKTYLLAVIANTLGA